MEKRAEALMASLRDAYVRACARSPRHKKYLTRELSSLEESYGDWARLPPGIWVEDAEIVLRQMEDLAKG